MLGSIEQSLPLFRYGSRRTDSARTACLGGQIGPGGPGLSKGHISPQLTTWEGGGMVRLSLPYESSEPDFNQFAEEEQEQGKRGRIDSFSRKSQANFRRKLAVVPDSAIRSAILFTLTYPDVFPDPEESETYKRHLDSISKAIRRRGGSGYWVLEFQKRKAPHYHLIVFGICQDEIPELQAWVSRRWYEIVGSEDPKHLRAGTKVEKPRSVGQARGYVAKYASKGNQALDGAFTGRYWGAFGRAAIPGCEEVSLDITEEEGRALMKIARRYIANKVWISAWGRLQKRAASHSAAIGKLSAEEFRQACKFMEDNQDNPGAFLQIGSSIFTPLSLWVPLSLACGGRPKFPQRWRARNNSTVHIFCNASAFAESMKKYLGSRVESDPGADRIPSARRMRGAKGENGVSDTPSSPSIQTGVEKSPGRLYYVRPETPFPLIPGGQVLEPPDPPPDHDPF